MSETPIVVMTNMSRSPAALAVHDLCVIVTCGQHDATHLDSFHDHVRLSYIFADSCLVFVTGC
jgi:hypothetical protein